MDVATCIDIFWMREGEKINGCVFCWAHHCWFSSVKVSDTIALCMAHPVFFLKSLFGSCHDWKFCLTDSGMIFLKVGQWKKLSNSSQISMIFRYFLGPQTFTEVECSLYHGNLVRLVMGKVTGTSIHMMNSDSYILVTLILMQSSCCWDCYCHWHCFLILSSWYWVILMLAKL